MSEGGLGVGRWTAGIAATVIAGVLVALILGWIGSDDNNNDGGSGSLGGGSATQPDQPTLPQPTLPDVLVGAWTQSSWNEAERGGITLGMAPFEGGLSISDDGSAEWNVNIDDQFQDAPPNTPAVRCRGRVSLAGAMEGTTVTEEINYTNNMVSTRDDIGAAFCGDDGNAYSLSWSPEGDPSTLEMRNDFGAYTWRR